MEFELNFNTFDTISKKPYKITQIGIAFKTKTMKL